MNGISEIIQRFHLPPVSPDYTQNLNPIRSFNEITESAFRYRLHEFPEFGVKLLCRKYPQVASLRSPRALRKPSRRANC